MCDVANPCHLESPESSPERARRLLPERPSERHKETSATPPTPSAIASLTARLSKCFTRRAVLVEASAGKKGTVDQSCMHPSVLKRRQSTIVRRKRRTHTRSVTNLNKTVADEAEQTANSKPARTTSTTSTASSTSTATAATTAQALLGVATTVTRTSHSAPTSPTGRSAPVKFRYGSPPAAYKCRLLGPREDSLTSLEGSVLPPRRTPTLDLPEDSQPHQSHHQHQSPSADASSSADSPSNASPMSMRKRRQLRSSVKITHDRMRAMQQQKKEDLLAPGSSTSRHPPTHTQSSISHAELNEPSKLSTSSSPTFSRAQLTHTHPYVLDVDRLVHSPEIGTRV